MRPLVLLTALLTLAAPLAGCIAPPDQNQDDTSTANTPRDDRSSPTPQTKTVSGTVGGSESKTETLRVPPGADALVVRASWSVGGSASFKLYDPAGKIAEEACIRRLRPRRWRMAPGRQPHARRLDVQGQRERRRDIQVRVHVLRRRPRHHLPRRHEDTTCR